MLLPGFAVFRVGDRAVRRLELFPGRLFHGHFLVLECLGHIPGVAARVVERVMKNLAHRSGPVAGGAENARQGGRSRARLCDVGGVVQHTGRFRVKPAQERRARGAADRVLAIGIAEGHRLACQAVQHRRLQAGVTGGRDAGTQIVADNEEHIGPPRGFGGGRAQASERAEDDEQSVGELLFCFHRCFGRELIRRWFQLIAVSDDPRTLHRDPIIKLSSFVVDSSFYGFNRFDC